MIAAEAIEQHRTFLAEIGEDIIIRRYTGPAGPNRDHTDITVRARVMEYAPKDIVGPVQVGDRKIIALAEPLAAILPLQAGSGNDQAIVRGKTLLIVGVDDNTRRIGGTLVALEIQVRGK